MGLLGNGMAFLMSQPAVINLLMEQNDSLNDGGTGPWDLESGVRNVRNASNNIVPLVIFILGGVATIAGVYKLVTGLISHGKGQPTSWPVTIILLIVGLALLFTGIGALHGGSAAGAIDTLLGFGGTK